ncbi:MAG: 50S ribosomal protein L25 [Candidatus Zixiibacteriota bacterium]
MKEVSLAVTPRQGGGKGPARQTRMVGYIPGVVYGPQTKPESIKIDNITFNAAWKKAGGGSVIFTLDKEGKKTKVLIRELQRDPITNNVIHVDFHAISMTKPIHLSIPIHLVGLPIGVKTEGGILQATMREIEISCLPTDIPEHVEINVENLHIGDSIHVRDLSIPKVKILEEPDTTLAVVSAPTVLKTVEEEAAEAAAAAEAAGVVPGVEGEAGAAPVEGKAPAEGGKKEGGEKKEKAEKPEKGKKE